MNTERDRELSLIERAALRQDEITGAALAVQRVSLEDHPKSPISGVQTVESRHQVQEVVVVPFPQTKAISEGVELVQARDQLSVLAKRVITLFGSTSLYSKKTDFNSRNMADVFKLLVLLDEEKATRAVKENEFAYSQEYFELVRLYRNARGAFIKLSGNSHIVDEALDELIEHCVAAVEKRRSNKGINTPKLLNQEVSSKKTSWHIRGITLPRVYIGIFFFLVLCLLIAVYSTFRIEPLKQNEKPYEMPDQKKIIEYRPSPPLSPASSLLLGLP